MTSNPTTKKRIVIVGGGFGGVRLARQLKDNPAMDVTLVSDRDAFSYYPQLYHAATGGSRSQSSLPLAYLFAGTSINFVNDSIAGLDLASHQIETVSGKHMTFDYVVLAIGNVTNYFGINGLEDFSYNIKTIDGAEEFKRHLHQELVEHKKPEAHYVVVGAGPTGVELAAALGDYLKRIVRLHGIAEPSYKIDLVEAAPRVLPRSAEKVSARVQARLQKLGVNVMTGATVEGETATDLNLKGQIIKTQTVIWTAGVANNPFFKLHPEIFNIVKGGRVSVDEHLESAKDVYVIGDNAATAYSGLAQTAVSDADYVADDINRRIRSQPRKTYKPARPASVIPVGSGWAAVEWGNIHLYGWIGWALRRAADLIAYHDIERLYPAVRTWLQERRRDDQCAMCQDKS